MAQEAALKKVADSNSRKLLAYNKSSTNTGVQISDAVILYEPANRKSTPRGRGPAKISDVDETGTTVRSHSQTFKVARCYVRMNGTPRRLNCDLQE